VSSNFVLKLADFGLASVNTDATTLCSTECGTRFVAAIFRFFFLFFFSLSLFQVQFIPIVICLLYFALKSKYIITFNVCHMYIYIVCVYNQRSYMSPEVMLRKPYDGAKADIWSAGVVLFILISGFPPFQVAGGNDWWYRACNAGRHDKFWMAHLRTCPNFPPLAQELLNGIFTVDPAKRISIDEIWEYPWMQVGGGSCYLNYVFVYYPSC
jgi:serine/threonine protein kinase